MTIKIYTVSRCWRRCGDGVAVLGGDETRDMAGGFWLWYGDGSEVGWWRYWEKKGDWRVVAVLGGSRMRWKMAGRRY